MHNVLGAWITHAWPSTLNRSSINSETLKPASYFILLKCVIPSCSQKGSWLQHLAGDLNLGWRVTAKQTQKEKKKSSMTSRIDTFKGSSGCATSSCASRSLLVQWAKTPWILPLLALPQLFIVFNTYMCSPLPYNKGVVLKFCNSTSKRKLCYLTCRITFVIGN